MVGGVRPGRYNPEMAPQEIRNHWKAAPFVPFRIHVSDGSHYDVLDPTDLHVDMLRVSVGIDPDDAGLFQRSVYISPNHVSRIEPLTQERAPGGNGRT